MKIKLKLTKLRVLLSVLSILLISTIITLVLFGIALLHVRNDVDTARLSALIIKAGQGIKQPAAVDPLSGKNYLPSARLVLPATTGEFKNIGQILYDHLPAEDDLKEEVSVASQRKIQNAQSRLLAMTTMNEMFTHVPEYQACSRGVRLTFEPLKQDAAASKTLTDGRTVYVYTETACQNPTLLDLIKQIESY